jgi:teichuronic acid biosynthesis glycosyltransferase TuaG
MNKISIITPAYNAFYIEETIQSVLKQTYTNWEMIVVDDNSKDDTVERVKKHQNTDERIMLMPLEQNVGPAEARNIALRAAKGNFVAFLDSDDMWGKEKLEKQLRFMLQNNHAFTFHGYNVVSEDGKNIVGTIQVPEKINYRQYLRNTIIGCLSVMIDIEKTGKIQMPLIRSSHDMALWLDVLKRGYEAYGMQEVLASYRLVSSSNTAKKLKAAKDVWKVYRDIEKLNFFYSLFNFAGYAFNATKKRL